jgi:acetyl esterase
MANNNEYEVDERDVEYQRQAGKAWLARVYQPKGAGPFPTIVDVHGGAWHNGDRTNNTGVDRALAAKGIVVAALDFRQPPEAGYPASICDVNLAIPVAAIKWCSVRCGRGTRLIRHYRWRTILRSTPASPM